MLYSQRIGKKKKGKRRRKEKGKKRKEKRKAKEKIFWEDVSIFFELRRKKERITRKKEEGK